MAPDVLPDAKNSIPAWAFLVAAGWLASSLIGDFVSLFHRDGVNVQFEKVTKDLDAKDPGWRYRDVFGKRKALRPEEDSVPRILAIVKAIPRGWPDYTRLEKFEGLNPNVLLDPPRRKILDGVMATAPIPELRPRARDLVRFPRGRVQVTLAENPYATLLPDHQRMREAAQLLSLDAWDLALAGKQDDALTTVRACLHVSRTLEDDPFLIGQLIRIAIATIAMGSAEKAMALGEASDAALAALQKALEQEARSTGLVVAMRGERAATHEVFTLLANGKTTLRDLVGAEAGGEWWGLRWPGSITDRALARREHLDVLKLMNRVVEAARLPAKDQFAADEAIEKDIKSPASGRLMRMLVPAVNKVSQAGRRAQACAVAMRALVAVERYRLKNGKWPAKLDDLVPAFLDKVPDDPIDGKPIRYKKWADGVVVYSIGNDRTDDGGEVGRPLKDFGYRLWNKEKRRAAPPPLPPDAPGTHNPPQRIRDVHD